jgi:type IV pilus assembly protein PilA
MARLSDNHQGFTIIEIFIVIAVIGILVAIILPQYAAYRIRGNNVAASTDLKNFKTSVESFFVDHKVYP